MPKPSSAALRWGAPAALAAAAIAVLLVGPVFGGTKHRPKDRINATEFRVGPPVSIDTGMNTQLGLLRLGRGDFVVTSTYQVRRRADADVLCILKLADRSGAYNLDNAHTAGPSTAGSNLVTDGAALSASGRLGKGGRAVLRCSTNDQNHPVVSMAEITGLKVPKVTVTGPPGAPEKD